MLDLITIENLPNTWIGKITNFIRYFSGYGIFPFFISFIITYRCNLNCDFCYQRKLRLKNSIKSLDLNFNDLKIIEKNIDTFLFKPRIHIYGGEPTIHKNFLNIIKFFDERNYKIYLTTNGTKLKEFAKKFSELRNFKEINISLNPKKWRRNIKFVIKKLKKNKNLKINVVYTFSKNNTNDNFIKILKLFEDTRIDSLIFQHVMFNPKNIGRSNLNRLLSQIYKIHKCNEKTKFRIRFFPLIKTRDIKNYYNDLNFHKKKCLKPWFTLTILPNGDVMPCEESNLKRGFGNVKNESLKKIWNNNKFRKFRIKIQKGYCIFSCCHKQFY
jgi:radical SAM protein with 4Fe4S-binding SPASM domain